MQFEHMIRIDRKYRQAKEIRKVRRKKCRKETFIMIVSTFS